MKLKAETISDEIVLSNLLLKYDLKLDGETVIGTRGSALSPTVNKKNGRSKISVACTGEDGTYIGRRSMQYHRVVWMLWHRALPEGEIHHKDGDWTNNHVSNLVDVPAYAHTLLHKVVAAIGKERALELVKGM